MAVTLWNDLRDLSESRKIAIIRMKPVELLDVVWTDEGELVENSVTLDDCESTSGWAASPDATAVTLDNSVFKEGSNSLQFGKDGTTSSSAWQLRNIGPFDATGFEFRGWVYIKNKNELDPSDPIEIRSGSGFSNYFKISIALDDIKDVDNDGTDGWNNFGGLLSGFPQVLSPDITGISHIFLQINVRNNSDLIAHGNIKMDFWRLLLNPIQKYSTPLNTFHNNNIDSVTKDGVALTAVSAEPHSPVTIIDNCETADWAESSAALPEAVDLVNFKEGAGSLNLGKTGGSVNFVYSKTIASPKDGTDKNLVFYIYIEDSATLNKLRTTISLKLTLGSSVNHYYRINSGIDRSNFSVGWTKFSFAVPGDFDTVAGSPDIKNLDFLGAWFLTTNAGDTIALGDIKMDFWHLDDGTTAAADTYFYDDPNNKLFITLDIDDNPYDSQYTAKHIMYFSNDKTFVEAITDGNASIVPEPRIDALPKIKISNSGMAWGISLPGKAKLTLNNHDGLMDEWFRDLEWFDADCDLYIGGESLPFSEYQLFYSGRVSGDPKWSRKVFTVPMEDKRKRAFQENQLTTWVIGTSFIFDIDGDFVGQSHQWRGKAAPRLYGQRLNMVPIIGVNTGYTLGADMDASQTTFELVDFQHLFIVVTIMPNEGILVIDGEKMVFTKVLGSSLVTVTRAQDNTLAVAHIAGAQVKVLKGTDKTLTFNHFKGIVAIESDLGSLYIDDIIFPLTDTFREGLGYLLGARNSAPEIEDGTKLSADVFKSSGDALGSMIEQFLLDVGVPAGEINSASFTTLDGVIGNSTPGMFFDSDDKGIDALNLMLRTALAYININSSGELYITHWTPVVDASELKTLTVDNIESWKPRYDSKRMRTRTKVLYQRKYALSGEKGWSSVTTDSPRDGIVPVNEKENKIKTCEYASGWAQELADHIAFMTMAKQTRVDIPVLELKFIESKPGDRLKVIVDRPWADVQHIFEIESIEINIKQGGVDIKLGLHDVFGWEDRVGGLVADGVSDYAAATDDEIIENCYLCDDDGFIIAGDVTTLNRKVLY